MDEGTMIWYQGSGIYQDGIKIADIEMNEMMDLLTQQGYTIIRQPQYDDIDCHPNYDPETDSIKGAKQ